VVGGKKTVVQTDKPLVTQHVEIKGRGIRGRRCPMGGRERAEKNVSCSASEVKQNDAHKRGRNRQRKRKGRGERRKWSKKTSAFWRRFLQKKRETNQTRVKNQALRHRRGKSRGGSGGGGGSSDEGKLGVRRGCEKNVWGRRK